MLIESKVIFKWLSWDVEVHAYNANTQSLGYRAKLYLKNQTNKNDVVLTHILKNTWKWRNLINLWNIPLHYVNKCHCYWFKKETDWTIAGQNKLR